MFLQINYLQLNKLVTLNKGVSKYFSSKMARFHQLHAGKGLAFFGDGGVGIFSSVIRDFLLSIINDGLDPRGRVWNVVKVDVDDQFYFFRQNESN